MEINSTDNFTRTDQVYVVFRLDYRTRDYIAFIGFNYFRNNKNFIRLRYSHERDYEGFWR